MRVLVCSTLLLVCMFGHSGLVRAEEEVRVRPVDGYSQVSVAMRFPSRQTSHYQDSR
jgi:hypothetical protein